MTNVEFEEVVSEVLDGLPAEFKEHLGNLLIVTQDDPDLEQRQAIHLRRYMRLYGLYQGIPLNYPGRDRMVRTPDTITIFRIPILKSYFEIVDIKKQIRSTVLHEIGHYFGMTEMQLRQLQNKYR